MDSIKRLTEMHKLLMQLCHGDEYTNRQRFYKLNQLVRFCAQQLSVARVSVWALDDAQTLIACEVLYLHDSNAYQRGVELQARDFPAYFASIHEDRLINANDARHDPRTREFTENYLKPLNIFSMLDAPIFSGGKLSGVLCIEHVGEIRNWDISEISFAAAVADAVSSINEQDLWQQARKQSELLQRCDSLTGLLNRIYFQQSVERDLAENPQAQAALIVMGINSFTEVNDRYGYAQANQVLKILAEKFESGLMPSGSCLSRLGGDMFGFWLPKIQTQQVLENFIIALQKALHQSIETQEKNIIHISGAIGVFTCPYDGVGSPDPLRAAEIAMKNAKKNQADRGVAYFSSQWYLQLQEKQQQIDALLIAFEQQQLTAYYQPIFGQGDNHRIGLEALVRWKHPQLGIVSPAQFIPLIAELGLMKRLGDFMLRRACEDIVSLRLSGVAVDWVSVNLSAEHLYSETLVHDIENLLQEHQLHGSSLELEIVEELISQDSAWVLSQLHGLANLGISLAIDDFGTGYSSLSRLKFLPVRKLKVDKSFVDGLPGSNDDLCITRSIVGLGKGMNLELVAEGVETAEQADWLRNQLIDYLQGYLFAKPMQFDEVGLFFNKMTAEQTKLHH